MLFPSGQKLVSVVIPCLNEEDPIAGVVREVLDQYVDEVIVVDNGIDRPDERKSHSGWCESRIRASTGIWSRLRSRVGCRSARS